ncbi:uncharacterized protein LOC118645790 [Monomorium pharaonis]|uniref:uncharacterized protein LOC118645790 n=1 Tax=Monomorium pharaonis TaxID=307658 RepID=UPI001747885C|nr:uncharacterized protein LOC118645790 [Monomorium pharaonis]
MYTAIWQKLFDLIPEMQNNITTITSDFEKAQINSAKDNFPTARIAGCLFHFKQALAKKWGGLNISTDYDYILEKSYAVAHLPSEKINEGVAHIMSLIDRVWQRNEPARDKLQRFGTYMRTYWLPLSNIISVYKKPFRTNNTCENFHLHASKTIDTVEDFLNNVAAQRRYYLARIFMYNENIRRPNNVVGENIELDDELDENNSLENVSFLQDNLSADAGPGNRL